MGVICILMRSRRLSGISASLGVWLLVSCCFHKISDYRLFLRGPSISGAGGIQNEQTGGAARELFLNPSTIPPSFLLGVGISLNNDTTPTPNEPLFSVSRPTFTLSAKERSNYY